MPSAWNRIGVNWLDLSSTRLEPVINEIYNATLERDYWLRVASKQSGLNPPTYDSINTSYQIRFIYDTFEAWFRPLSTSSNKLYGYNEGIYVADDGLISEFPTDMKSRQMYFTTPYGKDSYNYLSGGNLSNLVNYDMSFLSNGTPNGRVNIEHLQVFYKILNLNLKNRLFTLTYNTTLGFYPSFIMNSGLVRELIITGNFQGVDTDLIADFNNTSNSTDANTSNFSNQYIFSFNAENIPSDIYSYNLQKRFFELRGFDASKFNFLSYVYGEEVVYNNLDATYTPTTPSNEIIGNSFLDVSILGAPLSKAYMPYTPTNLTAISASNFGDNSQTVYSSQSFIDINNSELISYYTEDSN